MWRRRIGEGPTWRAPRHGVGVQVWVSSDDVDPSDAWEGEPTGVIVSRGHGVAHGAIAVPRLAGQTWLVSFDSLEYRADGSGPFEHAEIVESMLVVAPYADQDPSELPAADRPGP